MRQEVPKHSKQVLRATGTAFRNTVDGWFPVASDGEEPLECQYEITTWPLLGLAAFIAGDVSTLATL